MDGGSEGLERVPLHDGVRSSTAPEHADALEEVLVEPRISSGASPSGRTVPTINWGEKRMSPRDLEASHSSRLAYPALCAGKIPPTSELSGDAPGPEDTHTHTRAA